MMHTTRLIALLAFLWMTSASYAQNTIMDSLKTVLRNPKLHDTTRLQVISDVMNESYTDNDRNYYVLNTMLGALAQKKYAEERNPIVHKVYTEWLASYYSTKASEYSHQADKSKAVAYHDKAIALLKSIESYDEMYVAVIGKASYYIKTEKDDKAIPLIFSALKYYEKDQKAYNREMSYAFQILAHVYSRQKQYQKGIAYSIKAIRCFDNTYKEDPYNQTLYLKALSYGTIAFCYSRMKAYTKTIEYSNKALDITKKIGADAATGITLSRAGEAHLKLGHFEEAEKLYTEVLNMKTLTLATDDVAITMATTGLGVLNFKKGNYTKANDYANKGLALSKKTGDINLQKEAADLIYLISLKTKNFEKALEMYQYTEKIVDSSQIEASKNALAQQLLKYNFEKKELKLKLDAEKKTAAKNNWLIGLSGVLLLMVLGGFFYYRNNKQKQAITVLEKDQIKQKLLVTQMNPHFIFNSIGNIQGLIYDHKNTEAVNYLDKFSALTRQILENSNENYISLSEEVEMTQNYLAIQQLLYHNKFDFTLTIEESIDPETIFLPPMLTQPFIENAIKHGLSTTAANGMISISFFLKDQKLYFEVSDNGKGFDAVKKTSNHKSLAMTITKERLITYTKNQDFVVHTDNIIDKDTKVVGAKVRFEIPYIYEN
ncbi:tetratricopeptide repeat-containing sensor histidine kinase [Flavobacterium sp. 25HG05S-40]|uniref:tetratricopeptide repeat-containing sensor histidine kinase n=1 Tax=Flavobacterium sp. 25HG05S-40 TaxID=3458682 RepID=UPI004043C756